MNEKEKLINFSVFDYMVRVVYTDDMSESIKARREILGDIDCNDSDAVHLALRNKSESYLILSSDVSAGTIAHEAWHCVRRIMEYIEADLENEIVGYHIGYLVDEVTNFKNEK